MESDHLNVPFAEGLYRILIAATQSQSIFACFAAFCFNFSSILLLLPAP